MPLKGPREVFITTGAFVTEEESVAGAVLVMKDPQPSGHGVGRAINDEAPVAVPVGTGNPASGTRVVGIALDDVVDIDESQVHRPYQRTAQVAGEPVALLKDGWVITDMINGTPTKGATAYLGPDSKLQATQVNDIPAVGYFETSKDAAGFAKVVIKIA